jgi:uncharacterized membrane protein YkvA (DUF1232 family)
MRSWIFRLGLVRSIIADTRLAARLVRDRRIPGLLKAVPVAAVLYMLSPLDIVPDFLAGFGQLDDAGVMILALKMFIRICPAPLVAFHRDEIARRRPYSSPTPGDEIIDAEFRRG